MIIFTDITLIIHGTYFALIVWVQMLNRNRFGIGIQREDPFYRRAENILCFFRLFIQW